MNPFLQPLSIAPMIDWTNSPFRVLMRLLAPNALLYTEMQVTGAIEHNSQRALYYTPIEHPIALQVGGSDPQALAKAALCAEQAGFDEINLNLGCPSDKVQSGHFGAWLMQDPNKVVRCIRAMKQAVQIPVTAKTRIGIDEQDSYDFFSDFVHRIIDAGTDKLIVHARKAWLKGLSPKQNRTIPPIHYDFVYRIKQKLKSVPVVVNGNIADSNAILNHLQKVDGIMLGRLACDNPYKIAEIHQLIYPESDCLSREDILNSYLDYVETEHEQGMKLSMLLKPIFNLFHGVPGTKQWKQGLMHVLQEKDLGLIRTLLSTHPHASS